MNNNTPYEIGKSYSVPTVRAYYLDRLDTWPVIGPKHEDLEYINFDHQHYHFDFRFLTTVQLNRMRTHINYAGYARDGDGALYSQVLILHDERSVDRFPDIHLNLELPHPVYKWLKCRRAMPDYTVQPRWLSALSHAYADKSLVNGHICPHRGANLTGLVVGTDGCVTCPLHGLRWNMVTGKLVGV
jgi:hypothetical protein